LWLRLRSRPEALIEIARDGDDGAAEISGAIALTEPKPARLKARDACIEFGVTAGSIGSGRTRRRDDLAGRLPSRP